MEKFVGAAEAFRHFSNNFIMHVKNYGMAGGFDPQHRIGKKITSDPANDVFSQKTAIGALAMTAILKLSGSIIAKHDMLFVFVTNNAGLRIGELAAARQCQLKECAVASESNNTAANDTATLLHRSPGCTIQPIPKALDCRVSVTP